MNSNDIQTEFAVETFQGDSRSSEVTWFDAVRMTFCHQSIKTVGLSCTTSEIYADI